MTNIEKINKKIQYNMIDLKDSYDLELLNRFYSEFMIPNFPDKSELEPIENWIEMFEDNMQKTSLKNKNDENIFFSGSIGGNSADEIEEEEEEEEEEIDFHIVLSICSNKEDVIKGESDILGGIVFEYYPNINCGCITYILVNSNYRGQGLAGVLLKEANKRLNENAGDRGHLGGCNAIFLETNSAEKVKPENDVMDPTKRHSIFHKLGIRLLDFDYIQPALSSDSNKCKDLLLLSLITENTPKSNTNTYYLPSLLIASFLKVFWNSCYSRIIPKIDWKQDVDYLRMLDQLDRRDNIPLLDLPWNRPWSLIDLSDNSDHSKPLITKFYNQILVPNFKGSHELESLENWFKMLPSSSSGDDDGSNNSKIDFHLLVALRYHDDEIRDNKEPIICGGLAFEYHRHTNCGLITYFLVGGGINNRAEVMAKALIQRAIDILEQNAINFGNLAGCNAIFLETSKGTSSSNRNSIDLIDENKITEISYRSEFLDKMGWMRLDFAEYIQPPLSFDKSKSLNLLVLLTPRIPLLPNSISSSYYLPNSLIINFIQSFWENTCRNSGSSINNYNYKIDKDYKIMIDSLKRRDKIPLLRSLNCWDKPFILIDLAIDFHQDLFNQFYNSLPSNLDIESSPILKSLLLNGLHNKKDRIYKEDIHILLLVSYQHNNEDEMEVSTTTTTICPIILGSTIFSYFPISNCGLISNILIKKPNNGHLTSLYGSKLTETYDIGVELLNESIEIINRISTSKTHISGPNAIFLETSSYINTNDGHNYEPFDEFQLNNDDDYKLIQIPFSNEIKKQGWLLVDIEYYQPPRNSIKFINENKSITQSLLCVLNTDQLPKLEELEQQRVLPYIPKDIFKNFLGGYWTSVFSRNQLQKSQLYLNDSSPNIEIFQQFKDKDKILLK